MFHDHWKLIRKGTAKLTSTWFFDPVNLMNQRMVSVPGVTIL